MSGGQQNSDDPVVQWIGHTLLMQQQHLRPLPSGVETAGSVGLQARVLPGSHRRRATAAQDQQPYLVFVCSSVQSGFKMRRPWQDSNLQPQSCKNPAEDVLERSCPIHWTTGSVPCSLVFAAASGVTQPSLHWFSILSPHPRGNGGLWGGQGVSKRSFEGSSPLPEPHPAD